MLAHNAATMLGGCQNPDEDQERNSNPSTSAGTTMEAAGRDNSTGNAGTKAEEAGEELTGALALEVRLAMTEPLIVMQMEDNVNRRRNRRIW